MINNFIYLYCYTFYYYLDFYNDILTSDNGIYDKCKTCKFPLSNRNR